MWGDRGPHGGASDQHAPRLLDARGDRRLALRHSVVGQVHRHAHTYTRTQREREMHMTTISFHSFRCLIFWNFLTDSDLAFLCCGTYTIMSLWQRLG